MKFLPDILHPMDLGADLCCDSLHKTLPVLTGGAILHCKGEEFLPDIKRRMALFGSTSPSYLIMLSCDMALPYLENWINADLERVCGGLSKIAEDVKAYGFTIPEGALDPIRLTLGYGAKGIGSEAFGDHIRAAGIEPEYLDDGFCVFLAGPGTTDGELRMLHNAIITCGQGDHYQASLPEFIKPVQTMSIRQATFASHERVPLENADGRVASAVVSPCPPGIPVILPGELVDNNLKSALKSYGISYLNVVK